GLDDRLQPRGDGLAPPPQLDPRLLPPAARLRPRRGAARAEMAREVQCAGPPHLGGPRLLPRARGARAAARARLPRPLGQRALPVALPAGALDALVAVPDAGVVLRDPRPRGRLGALRALAVDGMGDPALRARDRRPARARDAGGRAHSRSGAARRAERARLS